MPVPKQCLSKTGSRSHATSCVSTWRKYLDLRCHQTPQLSDGPTLRPGFKWEASCLVGHVSRGCLASLLVLVDFPDASRPPTHPHKPQSTTTTYHYPYQLGQTDFDGPPLDAYHHRHAHCNSLLSTWRNSMRRPHCSPTALSLSCKASSSRAN